MQLRRPITYNVDLPNRRLMNVCRTASALVMREWSLPLDQEESREKLPAETLANLERIRLTAIELLNSRQDGVVVSNDSITALENRLDAVTPNPVSGPIVSRWQASSPVRSGMNGEFNGEGSGGVSVGQAAAAIAASAQNAGPPMAVSSWDGAPRAPSKPWITSLLLGVKGACGSVKNWILSVFHFIAALFPRRGR